MGSINVDFDRIFFGEDDGTENSTLMRIRSVEEQTVLSFNWSDSFDSFDSLPDILLTHESKNQLNQHLRHIFYAIVENSNIIELHQIKDLHIPGELLAEWINMNKYVTKLSLTLPQNQSDIQSICDALKQDTIIKDITFYDFNTQESDIPFLGTALREKKGETTIRFEFTPFFDNGSSSTALTTLLKHAISPGSSIKRLVFQDFLPVLDLLLDEYSGMDLAHHFEKVLSKNTSLTSITLPSCVKSVTHILRGVVNSFVSELEFPPSTYSLLRDESDEESDIMHVKWHQQEQLEMISKMKHLKVLRFSLDSFLYLSSTFISSKLEPMSSLDLLAICHRNHRLDQLGSLIQQMSTWDQPRKLKLEISQCSSFIDHISMLKSVQLETFCCKNVNGHALDEITNEIPSWMFLKEIDLLVERPLSHVQESKLTAAVLKNHSLKKISIQYIDLSRRGSYVSSMSVQVQEALNELLKRNERLADKKKNPESVPLTEWPELLEKADPTGLNFSYECIRKIPGVFIDMLRAGVEEETKLV